MDYNVLRKKVVLLKNVTPQHCFHKLSSLASLKIINALRLQQNYNAKSEIYGAIYYIHSCSEMA